MDVAGNRLERGVGKVRLDQLRGGAEQAVAENDVAVEKDKRLARLQRFDPETEPAQLYGHRVHVHAVEAMADHVAQRALVERRRRLALAGRIGANTGQVAGQTVRGADQEVTRSDRRVAYLQAEDRLLRVRADLAAGRRFDDRVERRVEQALHQRIRRVVGPRRLATIAGELGEREVPAAVHLRRQRQQAFVHAAQLLGAEIVVVHRPQHSVLTSKGKMAQRFEEVVVGQLGAVQRAGRRRVPEKAAELGQRQVPAHRLGAGIGSPGERADQKPELAPEIAVAGALDPAGEAPQPGGAVVGGVAFARGPRRGGFIRRMEQRNAVEGAVLGHEQEDQPIHHPQELLVQAGRGKLPRLQRSAQRGVPAMAGEAGAEDSQRLFDAAAQEAKRAGAEPFGLSRPLLQPAGLGPAPGARHEARGMDRQPQQDEVGVDLAFEHRLEIELEECLAGQRLAVAQHAQALAVRRDRPEVRAAPVEELLHQAVRVRRRRAALAGGPAIERQTATDQVYRHRTEEPVDRICAPAQFGTGGRREESEPQFAQQRQAPLVVGQPGSSRPAGSFSFTGELRPVSAQAVPGLGDDLVQALAGRHSIVIRSGAGQARAGVEHPPQQIGRQQPALRVDGLKVGKITPRHVGVSPAAATGRRRRVRRPGAPVPRRPAPSSGWRHAPAGGPRIARRRARRPRSPGWPGRSATTAATC